MSKQTPWFSQQAVDFLDSLLTPECVAFEYGSGGSTAWLAERAKMVYSVEHKKDWFNRVKEVAPSNVELFYKPIFSPRRWRKRKEKQHPRNWKRYVDSIQQPECNFDIVLVDGRLRRQSALQAVNHLKSKGWLILDDSQRPYYRCIKENIQASQCIIFGDKDHQTTFWQMEA